MGIFCYYCEATVPGGIDSFINHNTEWHHPSPFSCMEDECFQFKRKFTHKSSLYRHLRDHHEQSCNDLNSSVSSNHSSASQASDETPSLGQGVGQEEDINENTEADGNVIGSQGGSSQSNSQDSDW